MRFLALVPLALASQLPFSRSSTDALVPFPSNILHPSHVAHSLELAGALTRSTILYTLKRDRSDAEKDEADWIVGIKGQEGFIEALMGKAGNKQPVAITRLGKGLEDVTYYSVNMTLAPKTAGSTTIISINTRNSHQTSPKPKEQTQIAPEMSMVWKGDLLDALAGFSDAEILALQEFKVKIKTPTPRIIEYTSPDGFQSTHTQGGTTITYVMKSPQFEPQMALIQYIQPDPVMSFRKLDRLVELSNWGSNMVVQDGIDLYNGGPLLKGQFSRLEFQKASASNRRAATVIVGLGMYLPPRISNPYYYDIVGNVSTSRIRHSPKSNRPKLPSQRVSQAESTFLELTPRYPLMGGWNFTFTIGYDSPLGDYVKRKSNGGYVLAVPFMTPITDVSVDDVTLRIRLPEGAKNIKVHLPFDVDSLTYPQQIPSFWSKSNAGMDKTYLDTSGRPTIVITKKFCTDKHSASVIVEYDMDLFASVQKPFAVGVALLSVLFAVIIIRKLNFGIGE